jgi:hypothetical protein
MNGLAYQLTKQGMRSLNNCRKKTRNLGEAEEELATGLETVNGVHRLVDFVVQRLDFLLASRGQQEVVHLRLQRVINLERRKRVAGSVADRGCLSRIPDPDFYPSRIQKQEQKRGEKEKNFVIPFL